MKHQLTNDQQINLAELGINAESLADMLAVLPRWIKYRWQLLYLKIWVDRYSEEWCAAYKSDMDNDEADTCRSAEELIDCIYGLLCCLAEDGHLSGRVM